MNIPDKLKDLLMVDSPDQEYDLPFSEPSELMALFSELEEKNLSLIQQGQEVEQQIENKQREKEILQIQKERELGELRQTELEIDARTRKTMNELELLQSKSEESNKKIMDNYEQIAGSIKKIAKGNDSEMDDGQTPL